ncbi:MAG: guanylate kinase [Anaerolineae bacterium]|nr:guanylate kinase [Anaerolineae bacterium]
MPPTGILFILVGPSGAGKNTLMKRVQQQVDNLPQLATVTTRSIREGEQQGREHDFVSHAEFQQLIAQNALVEWQQVHLNDLYGTPRKTIDEALNSHTDLIADIEFLGAEKVFQAYPHNVVLIFVTPSQLDTLAERITMRGNVTPEALNNRYERAKFEMTFAPQCHYLIINDALETATGHIRDVIKSERIRHRGGASEAASVVPPHRFHTSVTPLIQQNDQLLIQAGTQPGTLPAFDVADRCQPPHEALASHLQQTFQQTIALEALRDTRFDFVAPGHVSLVTNLPDVYLNYYYRCIPPAQGLREVPGWEWRPLTSLDLPPAVVKLVLA